MGPGWMNYFYRAHDLVASAVDRKPFGEKRKGLCSENTHVDRENRKSRARELTRINMEKTRARKGKRHG